jgi:membrane-bound ClpP family serine protease
VKVWALVGVTVVGIVAQPVLIVVGGIPLLSRDALDQTFPIIPLAVVVGAVVGALIIDRQQLSSSRVPGDEFAGSTDLPAQCGLGRTTGPRPCRS